METNRLFFQAPCLAEETEDSKRIKKEESLLENVIKFCFNKYYYFLPVIIKFSLFFVFYWQ